MSLSISNELQRIAASIRVEIDTRKLGPRQRVAALRFMRTGVVVGGWSSLPARIAWDALAPCGVPRVRMEGAGRLWWENAEGEEDLFRKLEAYLAARELAGDGVGYGRYVTDLRAAVDGRSPDFMGWVGRSTAIRVLRTVKFTRTVPKDYVLPDILVYDLLQGSKLP